MNLTKIHTLVNKSCSAAVVHQCTSLAVEWSWVHQCTPLWHNISSDSSLSVYCFSTSSAASRSSCTLDWDFASCVWLNNHASQATHCGETSTPVHEHASLSFLPFSFALAYRERNDRKCWRSFLSDIRELSDFPVTQISWHGNRVIHHDGGRV